jgi:hypothetical protein
MHNNINLPAGKSLSGNLINKTKENQRLGGSRNGVSLLGYLKLYARKSRDVI